VSPASQCAPGLIVAKSKEVKSRCNLAESSKEGYGSERAVLQVMMMMMTRKAYRPLEFAKSQETHSKYVYFSGEYLSSLVFFQLCFWNYPVFLHTKCNFSKLKLMILYQSLP
jgi:hypothetical protein